MSSFAGWIHLAVVGTTVKIYLCPSDPYNTTALSFNNISWARGNYAANAGTGMF